MVNSLLDNPCTTLPISENWLTDFTNSRCYRNYTYDSGWLCDKNYYVKEIETMGLYYRWADSWINSSGKSNPYSSGGYTYYAGGSCSNDFTIKRTQPRTDYKAFSSF